MNNPNPSSLTGDYHIVFTEDIDPAIAKAMLAMTDLGLPAGELISAILHDITPSPYLKARELGHTHAEILEEPMYLNASYMSLRKNHGCNATEALEVMKFTTLHQNPYRGTEQRKAYKAVVGAGGDHLKAMQAMELVEHCLSTTFEVVDSRWSNQRMPSLTRMLAKAVAADPDSSINDIWRAWLVFNKQRPYDLVFNEADKVA